MSEERPKDTYCIVCLFPCSAWEHTSWTLRVLCATRSVADRHPHAERGNEK